MLAKTFTHSAAPDSERMVGRAPLDQRFPAVRDRRSPLRMQRGGFVLAVASCAVPGRRRAPAVVACAVALLLAIAAIEGVEPASGAATVVPHDLVGQEGGAIEAIRPVGDLLWLGMGPRLLAVDASAPAAPRVVGRSPVLAGSVRDLAIGRLGPNGAADRAGVAWALLAGGAIAGLDISVPTRPVPLGAVDALTTCVGIAAVGDHVWVVTEGGDLLGYDVSDPRAPSPTGRIDNVVQGYRARRVGAVPGHVVVLDPGGTQGQPLLHVVDVRDAEHPLVVSSTTIAEPGYVRDMFIDGNTAWLVALYPEALLGFDVSVPAAPVLLSYSELRTYWARWLTVRDGLAYLTGGDSAHNYFVTTVVDVHDPGSPTVVAAQPLPRTSDPTGAAVVVNDTYWYATDDGHLLALDAGDPAAAMRPVADMLSVGVAGVVALDGDLGIVRSGEAVVTLDLAQAAAPEALTTTLVHYYPTTVALTGTTGYVVTAWQMDMGFVELHVLGVDRPTEPEVVATLFRECAPSSFAAAGALAALACEAHADPSGGVWLLDIDDPRSPARVGSISVGDGVQAVAMDGRRLYAATPGFWSCCFARPELIVADVADASAPTVQARLGVASDAHDFWVLSLAADGDFAYVVATRFNEDGSWWDSTLSVIDASDPRQPVHAGGLPLDGAPAQVVFAHGYLLLPGAGGVTVIDVREADRPTPIGALPTGGDAAASVAVQDGLAYVGATDGGLYVFAPRLEGWPPAQVPPMATVTPTHTGGPTRLTPPPTVEPSRTPTVVTGGSVFMPIAYARDRGPVVPPENSPTQSTSAQAPATATATRFGHTDAEAHRRDTADARQCGSDVDARGRAAGSAHPRAGHGWRHSAGRDLRPAAGALDGSSDGGLPAKPGEAAPGTGTLRAGGSGEDAHEDALGFRRPWRVVAPPGRYGGS